MSFMKNTTLIGACLISDYLDACEELGAEPDWDEAIDFWGESCDCPACSEAE